VPPAFDLTGNPSADPLVDLMVERVATDQR
jgi:hypothetical protein